MMPVRRAPGINLNPVGERTTARITIDSELLNPHRINPIMLFEGAAENFNYCELLNEHNNFILHIIRIIILNYKYVYKII